MLDIPSLESHSNSAAANRPWSTSASTSTAVLDLEKLHLPSLEAHSNSAATNRPWTYIGAIGPPAEVKIYLLGFKTIKFCNNLGFQLSL